MPFFGSILKNDVKAFEGTVFGTMADEIKNKYPNINVLNIANDKDLEDTKKELRQALKY